MTQKTAAVDITDLFGKPEDNPNFKPGEFFNTGFIVNTLGKIFSPDIKDTGYFIGGTCSDRLFNPGCKEVGFLGGRCHDVFYNLERKPTGYVLGNSHVWYDPKKDETTST